MNHIATGRTLSPRGELLPPHHGSQQHRWRWQWSRWGWLWGNSPSRQGARTETFVPQNWSSMAAALRNFSWMDTDSFRVFETEGIYRRKDDIRGRLGGPTPPGARPGGDPRHLWCGQPLALLRLCFGLHLCDRKIGTSGFVSSNSENISCVLF
jgi:hypothetical protein